MTLLRRARRGSRTVLVVPRVGLVGLLGSGNLGNDGSLEAVLAYLGTEHPDAILDFLCSGTDYMTARYGVPATRLRWYQHGDSWDAQYDDARREEPEGTLGNGHRRVSYGLLGPPPRCRDRARHGGA